MHAQIAPEYLHAVRTVHLEVDDVLEGVDLELQTDLLTAGQLDQVLPDVVVLLLDVGFVFVHAFEHERVVGPLLLDFVCVGLMFEHIEFAFVVDYHVDLLALAGIREIVLLVALSHLHTDLVKEAPVHLDQPHDVQVLLVQGADQVCKDGLQVKHFEETHLHPLQELVEGFALLDALDLAVGADARLDLAPHDFVEILDLLVDVLVVDRLFLFTPLGLDF